MAAFLPHVMQNLFNTPLLLAPNQANMIAAALSGRLDIRTLEAESLKMDSRALRDLAAMGRVDYDMRAAKKAKKDAACPGAQVVDTDGWTPYRRTESGIAIVPVQGSLVRSWGVGPYSGSTGYDGIWTQLLHAQDDDKVEAIWVDDNSGGGVVDGCFDLTDGIYAMSARFGGKPIWCMAADYAASAAYAIAAACDKVCMPKLGQVGSIGCIVMHADLTKALEDEGIKITIIRDPDGKARGNSVEPLDDATAADIFAKVHEVNMHFVERVAMYRGISKKSVSETNAMLYTGAEALATGLVTDVCSEPDAWMKLERKIART